MDNQTFNGQAYQDYFVLECLKYKENGTFIEIGSNEPIYINNTYILETKYNWRGLMIEYENDFLSKYKIHRPNSIHIISDARNVNYRDYLLNNNFPNTIDYLQIDLEASNKSTIDTLEKLNATIMDDYKFAVVTFEHDIYSGDYYNTRIRSREIFETRGYIRVFSDVKNGNNPYEDWYVHPNLVDMDFINKIIRPNDSLEWTDIVNIIKASK